MAEQHQRDPDAASDPNKCKQSQWRALQAIAFDESDKAFDIISGFVYTAQKQSIKLPIVKKAVKDCEFSGAEGKPIKISRGDTVVCDVVSIFLGNAIQS